MTIKNCRVLMVAQALFMFYATLPAAAQTYSVLYNFGSISGDPTQGTWSGTIAQGRDGSLYTTSLSGGTNNQGTVFKVTPAGKLTVLYSFCSLASCADGEQPSGGLTLRPDGHFLGTTSAGGANGQGTIFDITQTGTLTTLHSFTSSDGSRSTGPPILGADGSFYGVTPEGGRPSNCGTIYRVSGSVFTLLYQFDPTHGCNPSSLVLGTDGNLYGTASNDGSVEGAEGVAFRVDLQPGKATLVTVLYNFNNGVGEHPYAPLLQGADGNFYGTTLGDGGATFGSIFKMTPTGTVTALHQLNAGTDGSGIFAGLVLASDGNFYGAADMGGSGMGGAICGTSCGTLFRVTPAGDYSVVYNFDGTTGSEPQATPFQNTNGQLYGDTLEGGTSATGDTFCSGPGCGVFYSWNDSFPAFVSSVPSIGTVGSFVQILGQGFTPTTTVSFNGTPATATVVSGTYLSATVPAGATTGSITVTTSSGTLTSNKQFVVEP